MSRVKHLRVTAHLRDMSQSGKQGLTMMWFIKQRKRSIQPEAAFPPKPQPPPVARAAEASVPATLVGQREIRFEVNDVFETAQRRLSFSSGVLQSLRDWLSTCCPGVASHGWVFKDVIDLEADAHRCPDQCMVQKLLQRGCHRGMLGFGGLEEALADVRFLAIRPHKT
uniref:Uncharacterized protein n=1 Tax=Knipowitschia caucasica TaxID=637954 RepID=A0AAV2LIM0_KNICA